MTIHLYEPGSFRVHPKSLAEAEQHTGYIWYKFQFWATDAKTTQWIYDWIASKSTDYFWIAPSYPPRLLVAFANKRDALALRLVLPNQTDRFAYIEGPDFRISQAWS